MKKVLKIVLGSLLACSLIACIVLYIVFPNQTKDTIKTVWTFLNTPLPIIGITTLAVLYFLWQVIIKTRFGKKALAEVKEEYKARFDDLKVEREKLEQEKEKNKELIEEIKKYFVELCGIIPNKKVNDLGETFKKGLEYGKEETNCKAEEE